MDKKGYGEAGIIIPLIIIGVLVIGLFMCIDKVEANHLGVQVKFGQIVGIQHAGIQWTGPFVHVYQYDLRIRKATINLEGENSAPDKEGQSVFAQIDVIYKLKISENTVSSLWSNVGTDDVIVDRLNINPLISEGFKQATVKYEAIEILEKRQDVKQLAKENIKNNFPKEYFEIVDIVISNIHFSTEFEDALDEKKTATQLALKAENDLERVKFEQQQEIEKYKAEAEKLKLQRLQITELLVQQKLVDKWNGDLPDTLIIQEGSSGLFLNLARGSTSNATGIGD